MPSALLLPLYALAWVSGAATLTGQVVDPQNEAIPQAQVFIEPGLNGALRQTASDAQGWFRFDDVAPGPVGVFALAEGLAFGGRHINVAIEDEVPAQTIVLRLPGTIAGRAADHRGEALAGVSFTRVALLGDDKVGIPLAKLAHFGIPLAKSDADGRFVVSRLPQGGKVALKAGHPEYAQESLAEVAVGTNGLGLLLYPGVMVQGEVLSRKEKRPVAGATVVIRNAQPPHDTALTESDGLGHFSLRLKPGVYLCQAMGGGRLSPGWERLTVTGSPPQPRMRLLVTGTGTINGEVRDAVSGKPIAGARVSLVSNGNLADMARTGPTGLFRFTAAAGSNSIRLESAPGYMPPESPGTQVRVEEGGRIALPGFWLLPVPDFRMQVIDYNDRPLPGAAVTLLRPRQFGWRIADAEGWVSLAVAQMPRDGKLVGWAQHPAAPEGAVFALTHNQAKGARAKLLPLATVSGCVMDGNGKPLEGAEVSGVFADDSVEDSVLLWRCMSGPNGNFSWPAVVPGVPQRCIARAGTEATGESMPFNAAPSAAQSVGNVVVENGVGGKSRLGRALSWDEGTVLAGVLRDRKARKGIPALLVYAGTHNAEMVVEGLARLREMRPEAALQLAVLTAREYTGPAPPLPVLSGEAPGTATTYLLDTRGHVLLETFGMPPLRALQEPWMSPAAGDGAARKH